MRKFDFVNDFEMGEDLVSKEFFRPWLSEKDTDKWVGIEDMEGDAGWNSLGEDEDTCCPCCGCPCSPCFNGYEEDEEDNSFMGGDPVEDVYIDNNLLNPHRFEICGLDEEKRGISYEDDTLYYSPLYDTRFELLSFDIGFFFNQFQYVLRVHKEEIYKAYEMACRIGELHILEEAIYLFYESVVLTAGLRYGNFLFGNLIKDYPDVLIPVMGKVFRVGGLIYIPVDNVFNQFEIDEFLGECHSTEDSDFLEEGNISYLMGCFGFDFLKANGNFADYCPLVDVIEGQYENEYGDYVSGLLIDTYWLTEGLDYDRDLVEETVSLVLNWMESICGIESTLRVANLLNAVCPLFSDLVDELKEFYCFGED